MSEVAKRLSEGLEVGILKVKINQGLREIRRRQTGDGTSSSRKHELHVSDFTRSEKAFCYRKLLRRYWHGDANHDGMTPVQYDGKFREEKWRAIFEAAGILRDYQRELRLGPLTGHPDFVVDMGRGERIVELTGHDSRNDFRLIAARTAQKKRQALAYVLMSKVERGFVIIEDKGNQETRVIPIERDPKIGKLLFGRAERMTRLIRATRKMTPEAREAFKSKMPLCGTAACRECYPK